MRLCILDFRHGVVLKAVDTATRDKIGRSLHAAESRLMPADQLVDAYTDAASIIGGDLDRTLRKRSLGHVWLNCSAQQLFAPRSSVLNRLIVAYLLTRGRFELRPGSIGVPERVGDGYRIPFENDPDRPLVVDRIIIRHGPERVPGSDMPVVWQGLENVWRATRQIRDDWDSARQYEDWTREPLYSPSDYPKPPDRPPPLRVDFGRQTGCVVVTAGHKPTGLTQRQRVQQAIEHVVLNLGPPAYSGRDLAVEPVELRVSETLSSSEAYEWAVRALCDTDVAVFDITGLDAGVMLLLGIRSAVRRGVTITITQDDPAKYPLPFNLMSLNPIGLGQKDFLHIAAAIEAALRALDAQPESYLDLPAFDAVRHLSEDHRPLTPDQQTLALRWFDPQYNELVRDVIEHRRIPGFADSLC